MDKQAYLQWLSRQKDRHKIIASAKEESESKTSSLESSMQTMKLADNSPKDVTSIDLGSLDTGNENVLKSDSPKFSSQNPTTMPTNQPIYCDSFSSVGQLEEKPTGCTSSEAYSEEHEKYPASFAEIMELVQKGEPIPGVEELNIEPTNTEPTPSTRPPTKKPWETYLDDESN